MVTSVLLLPSAQLSPFVCRATRSTGVSMVPTKVPNLTSSLSSASLSLAPHPLLSPPSDPFLLASTVGSPPPPPPRLPPLRDRDILLNVAACTAAISASWLFLSAIPTLLAFKSAAESLEKLLDVTREELPDTMAAVRLSGMEISDLTMELSDLGQEITQGVRSSTRAIRLAEDRLRQFTAIRSPAPVQFQDAAKISNTDSSPASAKTARRLREGIVKGRALLGALSSLTQFSRFGWNFLTAQKKQRFP